jgi:hypothetical protein
MKKLLFALLCGVSIHAAAQPNTFPATGSVGVGTQQPYVNSNGYSNLVIRGDNGGQLYFTNGNVNSGPVNRAYINGDNGGLLFWAAPGLPFKFSAAGFTQATLLPNGYFGLGYESPASRLEVTRSATGDISTARFHSSGGQSWGHVLTLMTDGDGGGDRPKLLFSYSGAHTWAIGGQNSDNRFSIFENGGDGTTGSGFGDERLTVLPAGNVGIGTSAPDQKLTVNGTIHATKVLVEASVPTPDYVFEKNYKLRTLNKVGAYIAKYKHLPEVASAAEMKKKGVDVNEMNMKLLQKVEELTLYMLELKRNNESQSKVILKQQLRLKVQERRLNGIINRR